MRSNKPWRSLILATAAGFLGLFLLDCMLFRVNLYPSVLQPDSSTGLFEIILRRERQAQKAHGDNMIVTLGDSRFAYAPRVANQYEARSGLVFRSAGVAGSDARSWYFMLRDLDSSANRYRAVVFAVNDYVDEDTEVDPADDIRALHYVAVRLRLRDALGFGLSFHDPILRWQVLRSAFFKGFVFQRDIAEFLQDPKKRIDYVRLCHRGFEEWTYNYVETPRSMAGLKIDWETWKAEFPAGADENQIVTVKESLMRRPVTQRGDLARFRREWFGRIIDRYAGSRTKIIFLRLARGPLVRPAGLARGTSSVLREFAATKPNVSLVEEHAFESLESPELFKDGIHLNLEGSNRFAEMLVREVGKIVGHP